MPSALTGFKRALVSLLLEVARVYGLALGLTRESPDDVVVRSYRKLMLKVHPDKPGGSVEHARRINNAWNAWNDARKKSRNIGRPGQAADGPELVVDVLCPAPSL